MSGNNQIKDNELILNNSYWQSELSQPLPILDIPMDFLKSNNLNSNTSWTSIEINSQLNDALNTQNDLNEIITAAYLVWIARLSNEKDLLIGLNINNIAHPLRISLENIATFNELLSVVKEKLEYAKKFTFNSNNSPSTIFETTLNINSNELLSTKDTLLSFNINTQQNDRVIKAIYNTNLFKQDTVNRFLNYYVNILAAIKDNKDINIYEIELLTYS